MRKWVVLPVVLSVLAFFGCGGSDSDAAPGGKDGPNACEHPCPATENEDATCWQGPVACSTVTTCPSGRVVACPGEGQQVDCELGACALCPPPKETDPPVQRCIAEKCCLAGARCGADPECIPCLIGGGACNNDGNANANVSALMKCIEESGCSAAMQ